MLSLNGSPLSTSSSAKSAAQLPSSCRSCLRRPRPWTRLLSNRAKIQRLTPCVTLVRRLLLLSVGCHKHVGDENMTQKTRFWVILAIINIAAMIYPVSLYAQADSNDTQLFAALVLVGVGFLLAITDTVSAVVTYIR